MPPEPAVFFFHNFPAVTQFVVHTHGLPFKSRKACDGKQMNVITYYLLILPAKKRIIANKNELAVDYYSAYNPKSTGLIALDTALGGGGGGGAF